MAAVYSFECTGKGGKNRRRGKNESEEKRELIFKEDGQGEEEGFVEWAWKSGLAVVLADAS